MERPEPEPGEVGAGNSLPRTSLQSSPPNLLSIQSSVVQAGHAALEAEFGHPIVDQQEVPQLGEKGTKNSAMRGHLEASLLEFPRTARHSPTFPAFRSPAKWARILAEPMALQRLSTHSRSSVAAAAAVVPSRHQLSYVTSLQPLGNAPEVISPSSPGTEGVGSRIAMPRLNVISALIICDVAGFFCPGGDVTSAEFLTCC